MKKGIYSILLIMVIVLLIGCGTVTEDPDSDIVRDKDTEKIDGVEEKTDNSDGLVKSETDDRKLRTVKIYYIDEATDQVISKDVTIETADDIWSALKETNILSDECEMLSCNVDQKNKKIDIDLNASVGKRIRNMGTTGEMEIIGCIANTYLDAYECDKIKFTEEGHALETIHGARYDNYIERVVFN